MESNGRQPGILIAVEGIDGAGKTTQVDRICAALENGGETVVRSKEPTNGLHGQRLRASAQSGRLDPHEELRTFIEDRREHVKSLVQPALDRGETVVLDRYFVALVSREVRQRTPAWP